jgi:hypothetical protein
VKFVWDSIKGEDKSERLKLSRKGNPIHTFRPNSLLQQGFLKGGGYIGFAEEKKGEFRTGVRKIM